MLTKVNFYLELNVLAWWHMFSSTHKNSKNLRVQRPPKELLKEAIQKEKKARQKLSKIQEKQRKLLNEIDGYPTNPKDHTE